ncbi:MAG: TRAP transporter small permease subunit [Acidaminococcaceae bacterium]
MKTFVELYAKILNRITYVVGVLAGLLFLLPALTIFYEVVMRGVFNAPTEWSIEASIYCVLIAGFLGMPVAYLAEKHIKVDIIIGRFSVKKRCYMEILTSIIGIFFCAVFFLEALDMVILSFEINRTSPDTLRMPLWIPQMAIPFGIGLLLLQFLRTILENIEKVRNSDFAGRIK